MDIDAIRQQLGDTPAQFARRLGVSDGHVADLKSGRRKLSLKLALKLEQMGFDGLLDEAVKRRTAA